MLTSSSLQGRSRRGNGIKKEYCNTGFFKKNSFRLYPAHIRLDKGNLMLRHSIHVLKGGTQRRIFPNNISFPQMGIEPKFITLQSQSFAPATRWPLFTYRFIVKYYSCQAILDASMWYFHIDTTNYNAKCCASQRRRLTRHRSKSVLHRYSGTECPTVKWQHYLYNQPI